MNALSTLATLMTGADYRESLRRYKPRVFVDGRAVASVADDPALQPGITRSRSPTTTRSSRSSRR